MEKFKQFREQYPEFIYKSYELSQQDDMLVVRYYFQITGLEQFTPSWKFPFHGHSLEELKSDSAFLNMVFSLGLVELVSYFKITCSPNVKILAGKLDETQIKWWKHLYYHGLGEFFYTNGIDTSEDDFMNMTSEFSGKESDISKNYSEKSNGYLIPIGGGKDSAVSLELLKKTGEKCICYIINPRGATLNTVHAGGFSQDETYISNRILDKRMIELNNQGFLNGHTPFSAVVAFSATISAYLLNLKYIALSNEDSANESTVAGSTVNHQYSKSFEFEKDFHEYEKRYLKSGTYYFSLLRPYSEFQIARLFAKQKAYHSIFRSCNAGSKEDKWCGHCPKCLFVFFILSPFLPHKELCEIFGTDMLEDETMKPVMEQLIGQVEEKPFECVGSRDEVNTAITVSINKMEKNEEKLPKLFANYKKTSFYKQYKDRENPYVKYFTKENLVPEHLKQLVLENGKA